MAGEDLVPDGDLMVLINAADAALRDGKSRIGVRGTLLRAIEASDLISVEDATAMDSVDESRRSLHTVTVDAAAARDAAQSYYEINYQS